MLKLKQDQHGLWSVPGLCALDSSTGQVVLDRTRLPHTAKEIYFGRGVGRRQLVATIEKISSPALIVVGSSSSKTPIMQALLSSLKQTATNTHIYQVQGHADHQAIRSGIEMLQQTRAGHLIVIGGGTTLDVGKAIAGLAHQEGGTAITPFQTGERKLNPEKALPWIAVPTTSGTGSESTNNAVIELGEEKRSIRNIPPPAIIIADPSFTDSLPLAYTIISLVDAVAQSLEVITHEKATPDGQALALAAFLNLVQGMRGLIQETNNAPGTGAFSEQDRSITEPSASGAASKHQISPQIRDSLSWGSLLMGIAFAHAGLGLPHALVHFCNKFGLAHGHMVGILLVPGLTIQAEHDPATARRLARIAKAFAGAAQDKTIPFPFEEVEDKVTAPVNHQSSRLLAWLDQSITVLFNRVKLATSLQQAGLSPADLDWIADREYALGASFAIPKRRATIEELRAVLQTAWSKLPNIF